MKRQASLTTYFKKKPQLKRGQTSLTTYFKEKPQLNRQEQQEVTTPCEKSLKMERKRMIPRPHTPPPTCRQPQEFIHSCAFRRMTNELKWYKEDQALCTWLPDIVQLNEDQLDILECRFDIPHHQPFKLRIKVVSDYPFKPLLLHAKPMPDELYECALNNELFLFREEHSPATKLSHIILTIWSIVTENDHEDPELDLKHHHDDPTWKGKTKMKNTKGLSPSSTPTSVIVSESQIQSPQNSQQAGPSASAAAVGDMTTTTRRKKLPVIERILFQQKVRDQAAEAQFEEDLQRALAASVARDDLLTGNNDAI